jgi:hypothetical protein
MLDSVVNMTRVTVAVSLVGSALGVAALAPLATAAASEPAPVVLAQAQPPPTGQSSSPNDDVEDPEDTGNWDTPPDSSGDFQPLDQNPFKQPQGILLPSDSTNTAPPPASGILLPPVEGPTLPPGTAPAGPAPGAAAADTLHVTPPAGAAKGPVGPTAPPATTAAKPEGKGGVFGLSPIAIVAGLAVVHMLVVKAATH